MDKQDQTLSAAVSALPLDEAAQKLSTLNEKARTAAIETIMANLCKTSPEEALNPSLRQHVKKLPEGEVKDTVLETMTYNMNHVWSGNKSLFLDRKIKDTLELVDHITSTETKLSAFKDTLNYGIRHDPDKTKALIEKSNLPDDQKRSIWKSVTSIRSCVP